MIVITIILIIATLFFETTLREVDILENVSLLYIIVNILFWMKKYQIALILSLFSSVLLDLLFKDTIGNTLIAIIAPLLILSIIDSIIKVESGISRVVFSSIGLCLSIIISQFLSPLIFHETGISFRSLILNSVYSVIVMLFITVVFKKLIRSEDSKHSYYRHKI